MVILLWLWNNQSFLRSLGTFLFPVVTWILIMNNRDENDSAFAPHMYTVGSQGTSKGSSLLNLHQVFQPHMLHGVGHHCSPLPYSGCYVTWLCGNFSKRTTGNYWACILADPRLKHRWGQGCKKRVYLNVMCSDNVKVMYFIKEKWSDNVVSRISSLIAT